MEVLRGKTVSRQCHTHAWVFMPCLSRKQDIYNSSAQSSQFSSQPSTRYLLSLLKPRITIFPAPALSQWLPSPGWHLLFDKMFSPLIGFPAGSDGKESAYNAGNPGLIPGSGRSPGEGTPVFLPGESHDTGVWWATVHGVTKSWTRLSDQHFHFFTLFSLYICPFKRSHPCQWLACDFLSPFILWPLHLLKKRKRPSVHSLAKCPFG